MTQELTFADDEVVVVRNEGGRMGSESVKDAMPGGASEEAAIDACSVEFGVVEVGGGALLRSDVKER